jgi:hypothetical protein
LVDGSARVACATPVRRVAGRRVTTIDGLDPVVRDDLVARFVAHGASQCGFCTPGILCRLAALGPTPTAAQVDNALLAHLCRCTGWRSILEAAGVVEAAAGLPPAGGPPDFDAAEAAAGPPDFAAACRRATLEGGTPQRCGPSVVLGRGGFADDTAPEGCLVAVPDGKGGWAMGETLAEARLASGRVQGRRSGQPLRYPIEVPAGEWDLTLQTTWVEPAYLEPDASWCAPGGQPAPAAANGGAFGGKMASPAMAAARGLAEEHGRAVRVVLSRDDVVRMGPKRPPIAAGVRADGSGVIRVAAAPGVEAAIAAVAPGLRVDTVGVAGPPVSSSLRGSGWAEAAVLLAAAAAVREGSVGGGRATVAVDAPAGGRATAVVAVDPDGRPVDVSVWVSAGDPVDPLTLKSYATGAAHMALGWVCSEGIAVSETGEPEDLTIRSYGILRARDTPPITVTIEGAPPGALPVPGSDAVFAAVAAATWIALGLPPRWPTRRGG